MQYQEKWGTNRFEEALRIKLSINDFPAGCTICKGEIFKYFLSHMYSWGGYTNTFLVAYCEMHYNLDELGVARYEEITKEEALTIFILQK